MRDREGFSRRQVVAGLGASGVGIAGLAAVCSAHSAFADDGIADEATAAKLLTPHAVPALNTAQGLAADSKRVLVVVDYQVDFADGALGNEYAVALEPAIYENVSRPIRMPATSFATPWTRIWRKATSSPARVRA